MPQKREVESVVAPVLVVDDEPTVREPIVEVLRTEGYPVVEADDGAAALELLRNGLRPGLILLDLTMPGMDGRQFRIEQAKEPAIRGIGTVVLTGAPTNLETLGRELGVTVLAKPLQYDQLLALVSGHCSRAA